MNNTPSNYTFKGRYTLRNVNGMYFIYDREIETILEPIGMSFKEAEKYVLKKNEDYKEELRK